VNMLSFESAKRKRKRAIRGVLGIVTSSSFDMPPFLDRARQSTSSNEEGYKYGPI